MWLSLGDTGSTPLRLRLVALTREWLTAGQGTWAPPGSPALNASSPKPIKSPISDTASSRAGRSARHPPTAARCCQTTRAASKVSVRRAGWVDATRCRESPCLRAVRAVADRLGPVRPLVQRRHIHTTAGGLPAARRRIGLGRVFDSRSCAPTSTQRVLARSIPTTQGDHPNHTILLPEPPDHVIGRSRRGRTTRSTSRATPRGCRCRSG